MWSYSRVECFRNCQKAFQLKYIDKVELLKCSNESEPLIIGKAIHLGIEKGFTVAKNWYINQFFVLTDMQITQLIIIEYWVDKIRSLINECDCIHEVDIKYNDFVGIADLLIKNSDGSYDLIDFKYSNNIYNYINSSQLHLYNYFLTLMGYKINKMGYLFIPPVQIPNNENIIISRIEIEENLKKAEPKLLPVGYNHKLVGEWFDTIKTIKNTTTFTENNDNCFFCAYEKYCKGDLDMLPKCERRNIDNIKKRKIWIYGASMLGKTTFVDSAPNPLNLNTDGNIQFVTMPFIGIKDYTWVEGRTTKHKSAWEIFIETLGELETTYKTNGFKTVVIDLIEDLYESCRLFMYEKLGITHESDDSFKAWDKVRTLFLSTMRRFFNLPYENLIIISHENKGRDLTAKSGDKITSIKPNIQDKIATKLGGMVDVIARVDVDARTDKRYLDFRSDNIIFGGGRLKGLEKHITPLSWDEFIKIYEVGENNRKCVDKK